MARKNTTGASLQKLILNASLEIDVSKGITIPERKTAAEKPKVISEAVIETAFRKMVLSIGGKSYKLSAAYFSGLPDRLVLLPSGRAFFAELKSSIGKPSPKQLETHRELKALGFDVLVINSLELIEKAKQQYLKAKT